MTYDAAIDTLMALPRWADAGAEAYQPGLDRMHALLAAMGDPHLAYPTIHVGGTNGKGSTASFAAAILTATGRHVGLHTSPHLLALEERMRLDGVPAPADWLARSVFRYRRAFRDVAPSFFEATTALSFLYFADVEADVAVVEVGLGGRLDATNVLHPLVAAVTSIGLDHTDLLGETIEAIAREKGGIAKEGVPFFTTATGAALEVLRASAEEAGAPFEDVGSSVIVEEAERAPHHLFPLPPEPLRPYYRTAPHVTLETPARDYGPLPLGLPGAHQHQNAALAVRLVEHLLPDLRHRYVVAGLRDVCTLTGLRGRGEFMPEDPRITLDVAHNADGWRAAVANVRPPAGGRAYAVVGVMADKDPVALAHELGERNVTALPVALPGERAMDRETLAEILRRYAVDVVDVPDAAAALAWFRARGTTDDRLLVTGSHVTVAEVLRAVARAESEIGGPAGSGANPQREQE